MKQTKSFSLLSKSSLPTFKSSPHLETQSSKVTDNSQTTLGSRLASFAGNVTKSLGNIGEGPFDVIIITFLFSLFIIFFLF